MISGAQGRILAKDTEGGNAGPLWRKQASLVCPSFSFEILFSSVRDGHGTLCAHLYPVLPLWAKRCRLVVATQTPNAPEWKSLSGFWSVWFWILGLRPLGPPSWKPCNQGGGEFLLIFPDHWATTHRVLPARSRQPSCGGAFPWRRGGFFQMAGESVPLPTHPPHQVPDETLGEVLFSSMRSWKPVKRWHPALVLF